jgi:hypothetical protein
MLRRTFLSGILAAGVALSGMSLDLRAQEKFGRWEKLGERKVNLIADRDVIQVGKREGGFRQIRIHVLDNAITVERVVVVYGNGANDDLPVRALIPAGGKSRVIDLRGGKREIRRIEMRFKSIRNGRGRATVEVWARR